MQYIFKKTSFIKTGVVESKKDLDIAVRISKKPIKKTNKIIQKKLSLSKSDALMIENNCSLNKKYNNSAAKKPISGVIILKKYN